MTEGENDMKFRKKPIVVEAQQLENDHLSFICVTNWVIMGGGKVYEGRENDWCLYIDTLEGRMRVDIGDWVIRGVKGEFYPCKPDIFEATYEPVESEPEPGVVGNVVIEHHPI